MGTTKDPLRYHRVPAHLSASALGLLNTEKSKKFENVSCKELFRYETLYLILDFLQRFAEFLFCNLEIDCRDQEIDKVDIVGRKCKLADILHCQVISKTE